MLRNYNFSDELLLQYGSTTLGYLTEDMPLFKAFDKDLGNAKVKELSTLIEAALREGGDDHKLAELSETTEKVVLQMNNSRAVFNELRYWVIKAFPKHKAVQRQFGSGRLNKAIRSQNAMIEFMFEVAETTIQYQKELKAVGINSQLLQQVAQQPHLLQNANKAQEQKKRSRSVEAEERIARLNAIFNHLRDFKNAAEHVFINQPAKRNNYRPPSTSANRLPKRH